MKEAALHVDAQRLSQWLLGHFQGTDPLSQRICGRSLDLLEAIALALQGLDRMAQIEEADRALTALRVLLRLAHSLGRLDERQLLHVHEQIDGIGRQLGGWIRRLEGDSGSGHRR